MSLDAVVFDAPVAGASVGWLVVAFAALTADAIADSAVVGFAELNTASFAA